MFLYHQSKTENHQWIVCDGPVDAVWIENMNAVMDNKKMLCLDNSEHVKHTPYVHIMFEVQDLVQASQTTVRHCGMACIDLLLHALDFHLLRLLISGSSTFSLGGPDFFFQ